MRIAYSKIGRSWNLDPVNGTATGGDADVARALHLLARSRPNDTFVLVGRNSGEVPQDVGYPSNVVNPWNELKIPIGHKDESRQETSDRIWDAVAPVMFDVDYDHHIMWLGQHGTTNTPLPMVEDRAEVTSPQVSFVNYGSFIIRGINEWRDANPDREEIVLCPDPRNYLKARDFKWPLRDSIIAQYRHTRNVKNERYGDTTDPSTFGATWDPKSNNGVWISLSRYTYNALELTALPSPQLTVPDVPWEDRTGFGMLVNENRANITRARADIVKQWVIDRTHDADIFGVWSDAGKAALGRPDIVPVKYSEVGPTLQRWRTTLTTPASGSGWATAKPWECFRYGTVCFFHPEYDTQDHILQDARPELYEWLRVKTPEDLWKRVDVLNDDRHTWQWLVTAQYEYYVAKYEEHQGGIAEILRRIG